MSNNNYDNDTAFINMINDKRKREQEDIETQAKIGKEVASYIRRESVRREEISYQNKHKAEIKRNRRILAGSIAGVMIAVAAIGMAKFPEWKEEWQIYKDTRAAIYSAISDASLELRNKELGYTDTIKGQFVVEDNDSRDYDRAFESDFSIAKIYSYKRVLDTNGIDKNEFNDFIRAMTYSDSDGEHYYKSFDDFLRVHNFPDEQAFEDYAKGQLLAGYRSEGAVRKGGK